MLFFHTFTDCNIVSELCGKRMRSACQTYDFRKLSQYPLVVDDGDMQTLEKSVVMMYNQFSTAESVDDMRLDMFAQKQRRCEAIPPAREA